MNNDLIIARLFSTQDRPISTATDSGTFDADDDDDGVDDVNMPVDFKVSGGPDGDGREMTAIPMTTVMGLTMTSITAQSILTLVRKILIKTSKETFATMIWMAMAYLKTPQRPTAALPSSTTAR